MKKQKTFQKGDYILVYVKANISNLTPAYNLIATEVSVFGKGAGTFQGESYYTEALAGINEYQIAYLTSDSASGKIKVQAKGKIRRHKYRESKNRDVYHKVAAAVL